MFVLCHVSITFTPKLFNIMERERKVVHLEVGDKHFYYGSVANLFEYHSVEDIGISYGSLRNYGLSENNPYQNSKCTIRVGRLLAKKREK